VLEAYRDLARRFDVVVIEGAGSVSELNLRDCDLVNLGLVVEIQAPWLLVADIERGGVFGSVVGTVNLLTPEERSLFRGFAINKFRGDLSLFDDGVRILEARTASRCLGVFPHADIALDAEDSLAIETAPAAAPPPGARIAIVRFPHLSNATDFRLLTWADWVSAPALQPYDFIVLPGSKNTIADMAWLDRTGLATWIRDRHRQGATVVGICGGYQMCGRTIRDPFGAESDVPEIAGLGLVAATTEMAREKRTRVVRAATHGGVPFEGYEIHVGVTTHDAAPPRVPFARLEDGTDDGVVGERVIGTYLHGALENPGVVAEMFGVAAPAAAPRAEDYRRLAAWFEEHARHLDVLGLV
jgi:adenosylcobyric acid synthase